MIIDYYVLIPVVFAGIFCCFYVHLVLPAYEASRWRKTDKKNQRCDRSNLRFNDAGIKQFGGDWVWLVFNPEHKLQIVTTSNQNSLLSIGLYPLLGNDVWEHTSSIHSLTSVINLCNFMQLYFLY
ncbi:hypothetical protein CEN40_03155 [Fischerella thermalis CCMEE 5205]|nr:hypothetical protein CEN40_03155 [Fischerella thermalis CCMEE 5205]